MNEPQCGTSKCITQFVITVNPQLESSTDQPHTTLKAAVATDSYFLSAVDNCTGNPFKQTVCEKSNLSIFRLHARERVRDFNRKSVHHWQRERELLSTRPIASLWCFRDLGQKKYKTTKHIPSKP